ncbi:hypothetical protein RBU61_10880 [Tissierella sp. MB52-C2]|uniref:hypothetical protein n=1 Tax=Tissierella sp. MB52-C2 TaxID=3070999 RepID=UPI00280AD3A5|nr:hypothetical protein [Tissierella sp. MB52-C2]WMM23458.1 hypothetical protein RBU61_10880 [Tissierella sp. MB52-C2]
MYINNLFSKNNNFLFGNISKKNNTLSLTNNKNIDSYIRSDKNVNITKYINFKKITPKMIENRKMIDFSDEVVSFEYNTNNFCIGSGSTIIEIPISDVSPVIDLDNVETLKVNDNRLILKSNSYYRFSHNDGIDRIYGATNRGFQTIKFVDNIYNDQNNSFDEVLDNTSDIINDLLRNQNYINGSKKSTEYLLKELGFKPGTLEVGLTANKTYKYFYKDSGGIINEKTFNDNIDGINSRNHIEYGVPKDAKWIIGGNEYHMNEDGYFNIPHLSDIKCSTGEFKLVNSTGQEIFLKNPDKVK